jgi:glycosyltransferase involved in cell wall biosynthesis
MNWSIVVFAFNEGDNLTATIGRCVEFLSAHAHEYEIILVDDGSTDSTQQICVNLKKQHKALRTIHQPVNLGIGHALRTGYEIAQYEYVCAIPGDGQFDPSELAAVPPFGPMEFYSFYRREQNYTPYRQLLSNMNRWLNRLFLDLQMKDVNWIKVYRSEQLRLADPKLTSSVMESEICGRLVKAGVYPMELPSICYSRAHGEAKGGHWKTVRQVLAEVPRLYLGF